MQKKIDGQMFLESLNSLFVFFKFTLQVKAGDGPALLYGDVIQLQHLDSGRFIGMQKAHAVVNHNNKSVILLEEEQEGDSCFFKVKV